MSEPVHEPQGPPRPKDTETKTNYKEFAEAVIELDGEWASFNPGGASGTNRSHRTYAAIGWVMAEAVVRGDRVYARLKPEWTKGAGTQ